MSKEKEAQPAVDTSKPKKVKHKGHMPTEKEAQVAVDMPKSKTAKNKGHMSEQKVPDASTPK